MTDQTNAELGSSPEVRQTPRQRVEASLKEKAQMEFELWKVRNDDPGERRWGGKWTEERYTQEAGLCQRLREHDERFKKEIVSNLPEAEAWVNIREEELIDASGRHLRAQGEDSRSYAGALEAGARTALNQAKVNLESVRAKAVTAPNSINI